ncbi:MAG TPA: phosphopentomutase [Chthoniobacterales bacterium]|jgi:phosphopentomutase|nr:phosphopentomutase [Chthoniobacterales bacterium]
MRALLLVLDSVGIGDAPDAEKYADLGANTLGHIREQIPDLELPNLDSLGWRNLSGEKTTTARASFGRMTERSAGKDTTTGHWEIAGVILEEPFATFERFPDALVRQIERAAGVEFIGNCARSGTAILEELGAEHLRSGRPILYTSADSVLQIAAHEKVLPVERLYEICRHAREAANAYRIGRVIARPFVGAPGNFKRTARRHDFSLVPPRTVLDAISEAGLPVVGVGKISDIFAGRGITQSFRTVSNADGMQQIDELWNAEARGLIFANLVDFDMLYGHRRDVAGYARALREFDTWLGSFIPRILPNDFVIITADHGNDPTWRGSDHTREQVPLLVLHEKAARDLGTRETFSDIAATLAEFFRLPERWPIGKACTSRL